MKIKFLEDAPFAHLSYLNAGPKNRGPMKAELPWFKARISWLPRGLDALMFASDLQGMAPLSQGMTNDIGLLGRAVCQQGLELFSQMKLDPRRVGVVLAGDLYSDPSASIRGASGEVSRVWTDFADHYAFVAGVAGNHDTFDDRQWLARYPGVHLFDGNTAAVSSKLTMGGVSGIVGSLRKNQRKTEEQFLSLLQSVVKKRPDILVLHQGPDSPKLEAIS